MSTNSSVATTSPLGRVVAMTPDSIDEEQTSAHVPALPTLRYQQRDLRESLREGFETRQDILLWSHAAAAVSAGRMADEWFQSLINDRYTVAACLTDESEDNDRRRALTPHAPDDEKAQSIRMDIIQETLSPAFQAALGDITTQAADMTDERDGVDHLDRQRFLALRPRMHQLAVAQHKAIRWAFGLGDHPTLDSRAAVVEWCDYVGYSCAGELADGFTRRVASPLHEWWDALTRGRGPILITLLASDVLPAMNAALRQAADDSEELANQGRFDGSDGGIS